MESARIYVYFIKEDLMSLVSWLYTNLYIKHMPNYFNFIKKNLLDCGSLLELGCANNSPLQYFRKKYYSCGLDIFFPYLEESRRKNSHKSYILSDISHLCIKPKSFDCVLALGLLEHLEKEEGLGLIELMETIARKKVIVSMPNGFLRQDAFDGNVYQIHKSGWVCEDLTEQGFSAYGFFGLTSLRKEYGKLRYRPNLLWFIISELTQIFTFKNPNYAAEIVYVKKL